MGVVSFAVESDLLPPLAALAAGPPPPKGRRVGLPGRGTTFVREAGPARAPALVLLHGWVASGGLNWLPAWEHLRNFRVIALDLRGHGRGIRGRRRFRLEDCADDVAALLGRLGVESAIAVGYSMGGPVAQLLWRRHPERVAGLVMCATSAAPIGSQFRRHAFGALMAGAAGLSRVVESRRQPASVPAALGQRPDTLVHWTAAEMARHHRPSLLEAGQALARYDARSWIGEIDVPTSVVVTERDRGVSPDHQRALARAIPGARVHSLDEGHIACMRPGFGRALARACRSVAARV